MYPVPQGQKARSLSEGNRLNMGGEGCRGEDCLSALQQGASAVIGRALEFFNWTNRVAETLEKPWWLFGPLTTTSGIMDMQITIKFPVSLERVQPATQVRSYPPGTRVGQVIADLNLPAGHIGMALLHGRCVDRENLLSEGDVLSLLPLVGGG